MQLVNTSGSFSPFSVIETAQATAPAAAKGLETTKKEGEGRSTIGPSVCQLSHVLGRRPNCFIGHTLNDRTILFLLVILLDETVSVG